MTPEERERMLLRKADQVRHRLLDVVDEIDRRRHELTHPGEVLARRLPRPEPWAIAAAAAAGVIVASLVGAGMAKRRRRRRKVLYVARAPPPPTFSGDVLSRVGRALATFGLVQLGKSALTHARLSWR